MTRLLRAARLKSVVSFKSLAAVLLIAGTALMAGCGSETLASISVGPPDATLTAGLSSQYVATGIYSDGTKKDLSSTVTWSSSTPAAAKISGSGLATAVSAGTTTITATLGTFSGTTNLTVTGVTLVSIEVTPTNPSLAVGVTEQFTATGVYSDDSTQNLTAAVTWNSATPGVATINSAGLAASVEAGSSVITATYQGISGTTALTVTGATLVSIGITPATATLAKGTTQQFVATGLYNDNSTHVLTNSVTWASSGPGVATISNTTGSNGLAKALAVGTASITASSGSITSPAVTLTVTAATLVSIGVTPANPTLPIGSKLQFVATGTYSDNSTQVVTTAVTWTSSVPAKATISNAAGFDGLASAVAIGTTAITATLGGVSSPPVTLTVTAAVLASIGVTPANPTIGRGATLQFVAMGVYTDNTTQVLTTSVTWKSATPAVATISNASPGNGLAASVTAGTTVITATLGSVTSPPVTLTVSAATLVSIAVTPATPSIPKGLTQAFVATGTYSDNSTQVITTTVAWASATPATATISNTSGTNGVATGLLVGTTAITASLGAVASTPVTLTVTAAALASIAVTAPTLSVPKGLTDQFTATGTYTDATTQNITTSVTWGSATPATATISSTTPTNGVATTLATGTTAISAALGIITSPLVTLTVTPATLSSIAVTPTNPTIRNQTTEQFTATGTYTDGPHDLTGMATWASGTPGTATISNTAGSNGLATALAAGATAITAAFGGMTSTAQTLTVTAAEYLYVSDSDNGHVLQYVIQNDGTLAPMVTPYVPADLNPNGLAIDPSRRYLYVANIVSHDVSQFAIGADGSLTVMAPPTVQAGLGANAVTIDAAGAHAYVPNSVDGTVSQFNIDGTTGALTPMATATVASGGGAAVMAIDPVHTANAYVANYNAGTISHFTIAAGALTLVVADTVTLTGTAPINPNSLVIDPTGTYLYVADEGNGTIAQFSIDATSGALTPLATPYIAQGTHSLALLVKGGSTNVYTPNSGSGNLIHFQIGAGGNLGAFIDFTSAGAADPISIAFDPSGSYAYSADFTAGMISQFTVAANGTLTALPSLVTPPGTLTPNPAYMVTTTQR